MDLVDRRFARSAPDQLRVTDITEHPVAEGGIYCAVVLDAHSWRVVDSSIGSSPAALVTNALGMAMEFRRPPAGAIIDSDRGAGDRLRQLFTSNDERAAALAPWIEDYNARRRHSALGGLPPISRLAPT